MFKTIKKEVNLVELAESLFRTSYRPIGDNTFAPEDKQCHFCGHKDCLRIKQEEDSEEGFSEAFYHCFSCGVHGDAITLTQAAKELETPMEAAKLLVKEYKLTIPRDYSPGQEAFNLAANYYHEIFNEQKPYAELNGLTPLEYQTQVRGHSPDTIKSMKIGWSDGNLLTFLESVGIAEEIIESSGLKGKKGDFLPAKVFIYPHVVSGKVSHFTFKDPLKQKEWQLPNKHKMNGHSFFNSDSIKKQGPVIIVEGENDLGSILDYGWDHGVIACIGQISASQLEWLGLNLAGRDVITIFDSDPAGDLYRDKVSKVKGFGSIIQVKLPAVKDVDEYIKAGGDLVEGIKNNQVARPKSLMERLSTSESVQGQEPEDELSATPSKSIIEKDGAYYKIKYKDGNEFLLKLSNFTIKLRNIFIRSELREREVIIIREDGVRSFPVIITSEAKVSLRPFKAIIANAVDATFYGKEEDLSGIWEVVYSKETERVVYLPEMVGRVIEFKGWLFRDFFVTDEGTTYEKSDDGVIWIGGVSNGIKPMSLSSANNYRENSSNSSDIPRLVNTLSDDDVHELIHGLIKNFSKNLNKDDKHFGSVITALGFMWSCIYSEDIFNSLKSFPILMVWGDHGKGKTTLLRWLLEIFNLSEHGYTTVAHYGSGVGWSRKMAYYSSLPMCLDELRSDKTSTDLYDSIRASYDRSTRVLGTREAFGVRVTQVRANLILGGQDLISDPATLSRCITFRIPKDDRETSVSYNWVESRKEDLSAIGNFWIKNYSQFTVKAIVTGIKELGEDLKSHGCPPRISLVWATAGFFGKKLADHYFPEYDYLGYLVKSTKEETVLQSTSSTLHKFFDIVEGLQVGENSPIGGDHLRVEGDTLYIWFAEVFREVERVRRNSEEIFSAKAMWESLREEDFFIKGKEPNGGHRVSMGMSETIRRVAAIDLTKAPDVIKSIASFAKA